MTHDFSEQNLGLNRRMISAIQWVFGESESAIILEDDCLPHPRFFGFCSSILERYQARFARVARQWGMLSRHS